MVGLGDIGARSREIEYLVSNAEFERAFVRTIDFAKEFCSDQAQRHEALLHSGNYKELVRENRRNVLTPDEFHRRRSQCVMSILQLIDDIVDRVAGVEMT